LASPSTRLRRLLRTELAVGQKLDEPILDIDGRVLFPTGRELTQADLDNVNRRGGYVREAVAPDEPTESSEAEQQPADGNLKQDKELKKKASTIMTELSKQHVKGDTKGHERRKHARKNWQTVIKLILNEDTTSLTSQGREIEVTTQDISVGGFGFLYSRYLYPDTEVIAKFDCLPGKPMLRGVICDCHLIGGMQHRVGVRFTKVLRKDK